MGSGSRGMGKGWAAATPSFPPLRLMTVLAGLKAQISLILGLIWLSGKLYEDWNMVNMKEMGNKMQKELGELGGWPTTTLTL